MQPTQSPTPVLDRPSPHAVSPRATEVNVRRRADTALVVALLGPPALVVAMMALRIPFAVAVCAMFAVVFAVATAIDVRWMWQRRSRRRETWSPE
jgi:hypothetical protein